MSLRRFMLPGLAFLALLAQGATAAEPRPPRQIDARRLAAAGIRILEGQHIRLATDLPSSKAVDELPAIFDAAVPQWAAYFDLPETSVRGRWLAFLISDRERFAALGLLPEENPAFINGYARDYELWLVEQPSDYYRRHLLLHEGTHAFMQTQLGGAGPGWYMEGMAELLGTHRWQDGTLTLGVMPASKEEVPMWGRVKIIRDAAADGRAWPLERVLAVEKGRMYSTEHYAWTWALAALLDGHPQFRERIRSLKEHVADPAFNERFRELFAEDWGDLLVEWEAYVAELDYGYDAARMAMIHQLADAKLRSMEVAADRGWQSTGWLLRAGRSYRIAASGRYRVADDGGPWPCEPGGVTIDYHDGRPLGMLLGALRPMGTGGEPAGSFGEPTSLGREATLRPERDGILYVRVNDSPASLGDNQGQLTVRVDSVSSTPYQ